MSTVTETPLSCLDIAKEIRKTRGACSNVAVISALQRLGINPVMTTASGRRYYDPEAVEAVRADLRAANGSSKTSVIEASAA